MKSRRTLMMAAIVIVGLLAMAAVVLEATPPVAVATDAVANSGAKTILTPHVYDMPPEQTRQVAGAVGATVLGWKVANSDPTTGTIRLFVPARFGLAHDEVTALVLPSGKNAAVAIMSQAHYRGLDFGANARHIRDLQAAMDKQLPAARRNARP